MRAERRRGAPPAPGSGAGAGPGSPARAAALALSVVLAAASGCSGDGGVDTGRPADVPPRRLLSARWDTLFLVGGGESDTLFLQATRIGADGRGVSLVDGYSGRVLRFDADGALVWSYGGRGPGPDEFRHPRDLEVDAEGRTWVLDVRNARITVVGPEGRPAFRIPLDGLERPADGVAPMPGDRAVVFTFAADAPFVTVDRGGSVTGRRGVPWDGFARLDPLATQMKLAAGGRDGVWAAAFGFGDGFHLFDREGDPVGRGWFAEPVPFPGVSVSTSGSGLGRSRRVTRVERPRNAAVSVSMSGERLYVLFGGRGRAANRWIDAYSVPDGGYVGSYFLPRPVTEIARGGDVFYVTYDAPFPTLAALRPREAPPGR